MLVAALVAALAAATTFAPAGGATNECRGIMACIRVAGRGCSSRRTAGRTLPARLPGGRSIVGGLDAQATSRAVRVAFDGGSARRSAPA